MEIAQVQAFLSVHKHHSFSRAATQLHLSQPAMSRRIALLERELGAPLFDRLPRGTVLTDAGRAYLPHAEAMSAANLDAVTAVGEVVGGSAGTVTLALVGTLAGAQLSAALRSFRESRPGVRVSVRTARSALVSDIVRQGEAMLGLRYEADASLDSEILYHEPLVAICAPGHPLAGRRRIMASALADERWLAFPPIDSEVHEPYTSALREHLTRSGLARVETMFIDSLTAQKRLVEAGFGLAFVPTTSIEEELHARTLAVLNLTRPVPSIPVALVRRPGAAQSTAIRALVAALHSHAGGVPGAV